MQCIFNHKLTDQQTWIFLCASSKLKPEFLLQAKHLSEKDTKWGHKARLRHHQIYVSSTFLVEITKCNDYRISNKTNMVFNLSVWKKAIHPKFAWCFAENSFWWSKWNTKQQLSIFQNSLLHLICNERSLLYDLS